ncbi:MAG: hypothetical protein ACRDLS_09310 [Solirubrobacteraceae bacterium]
MIDDRTEAGPIALAESVVTSGYASLVLDRLARQACELRERIFERFFRGAGVERPATRKVSVLRSGAFGFAGPCFSRFGLACR